MLIDLRGVNALRNLRRELQDNAGSDFPNGVMTELLVLYDVCKTLDLNLSNAEDVLGETGLDAVSNYINSPAISSFNVEKALAVLKNGS